VTQVQLVVDGLDPDRARPAAHRIAGQVEECLRDALDHSEMLKAARSRPGASELQR
jgi:hypothetical protein